MLWEREGFSDFLTITNRRKNRVGIWPTSGTNFRCDSKNERATGTAGRTSKFAIKSLKAERGRYGELLNFAQEQNKEFQSLNEENKTLRERVAVLEQWKDKMVQWAKEKLPRVRKLAASFFRTAGMPREANKYKNHELER